MRRTTIGALALAAPALAGCWVDDTVPPPPHNIATITAGDFTLRVDPEGRDVALLHGDTVLLDFPADGFELGTLPALDDMTNYDPIPLAQPTPLHPAPDGLVWLKPDSLAVTAVSDTALSLTLAYPAQQTATITFTAPSPGTFRARWIPAAGTPSVTMGETPKPPAQPVAYFRLQPRSDKTEGFYGLGEAYDDVNQRGKTRPMQIEIDTSTETGYNNVHVPIPFVIGTRGWGMLVESRYPGVFVMPSEGKDQVQAFFGTGLASGDGLAFDLFGEDKPIDVVKHYYDLTGYPRIPARWALGPWVWRDENKDQAQAESDLETMRDLDLPATAYWVDRPYETGVETFDWDVTRFPDAQHMIDLAHDLGFGFALWHTAVLDKKDPAVAELRMEADSKGYFPPTSGLPLNPWGKLIDLTNPDAFAWWQGLIENYTSMGVEGFKLDYAEDVVPGLNNGRNVWEFYDGSDERTMHSGYTMLYHQVYQGTLPAEGSFLLCRHGTWGDQVNASVIWPGDLDASFARNGETMKDGQDEYVSVGGLPATVIAGLSLGASGYPFFGADTGGYLHSPPDKELFTRWFEQTALSSVMQMGNSASTVAWEPDATTGYDQEMLGWYRTYTRLHLRLFPYEWTYAQRIATDGRPIQRAIGLAYPEMGIHPSDEYLFGDDILVAPVLARGATEREVTAPPGKWVDWWTGEVKDGGAAFTAQAPLGTLPLYLRQGSIVPMLRPTIDTLRPVASPDEVDSYATTPGLLWARVAPGPRSTFTLFDGAEITQEGSGGAVSLSSKDGGEFNLGVMFEVIAVSAKPSQVTGDGAALTDRGTLAALQAAADGWAFAPDTGGTVYVKVPAGGHAVVISP